MHTKTQTNIFQCKNLFIPNTQTYKQTLRDFILELILFIECKKAEEFKMYEEVVRSIYRKREFYYVTKQWFCVSFEKILNKIVIITWPQIIYTQSHT